MLKLHTCVCTIGPLLFIIYINDLVTHLTESRANLYADDTAILCTSESYLDVILSLRIEMDNVVQWLRLNKLTLNVKKTKLMIFGTQQKLKNIKHSPLYINNEIVENVEIFKYLGMILDPSLTFSAHINKLYKKTCSKIGMIKKVRYLSDHSIALTLYKSLVLPHLDYCDTIYMTSNQEDLNKLQLAQNVACRTLLLADKYEHIDAMHQELKLEKLEVRRKFH